MNWVELVGYIASALVVLSFAMSSIVKIRSISLVGSAIYVVYGLLIGSFPIMLANGTIRVIGQTGADVVLALSLGDQIVLKDTTLAEFDAWF